MGRRCDDDRERGLGLSELIVAVVLFGIMLTAVSGLVVSTQRGFATARAISENTRSASNGMNEAARMIRAGTVNPVQGHPLPDPAFVSAATEALTLYAYVNLDAAAPGPVMVRLEVDGQRRLVESRWAATPLAEGNWSFPAPTEPADSIRTLAESVSPGAAGAPALFTYFRSDGTVLPDSVTGVPLDHLGSIASVKVTLTVQSSRDGPRNPVTLQNTVGIPNLGLTRTGG